MSGDWPHVQRISCHRICIPWSIPGPRSLCIQSVTLNSEGIDACHHIITIKYHASAWYKWTFISDWPVARCLIQMGGSWPPQQRNWSNQTSRASEPLHERHCYPWQCKEDANIRHYPLLQCRVIILFYLKMTELNRPNDSKKILSILLISNNNPLIGYPRNQYEKIWINN